MRLDAVTAALGLAFAGLLAANTRPAPALAAPAASAPAQPDSTPANRAPAQIAPAEVAPNEIATSGIAGRLDGVHLWTLPDTPNGLHPTQSWHATGSAPNGDLYVAGMDHRTNAALYRLPAGSDMLRLAGDARSASEAAGNWKPGETAEKFHTRPLWFGGKVYVGTMDRSTLDDGYRDRRGFHLYAYDPATARFTDLSAAEPGGTGLPHGSLVTLAGDPARNVIYGAVVPTAEIVRYDVAAGTTASLGRPAAYDRPFVYTGRFMFTNARGRLYFSAGNPLTGPAHDPAIYGHLYSYDSQQGMVARPDFALQAPRALEVGRCLPARGLCYAADDKGYLYRFTEAAAGTPETWTALGRVTLDWTASFFWMFQVAPDGRTAYAAVTSYVPGTGPSSLYEVDLATGAATRLCSLADLDPRLERLNVHTGSDAWDDQGRFAFASFAGDGSSEVVLTRVDPVRLKAALARH
ncbi:hypothetical protein [Methylobacterium sp. Leaf117]|uniref:hypothetical protein n=1 Tax=Methylobacterium sp. Leaf117 TaxID=1736260 RepID=UPI0006FE095C|nr:hypothetical protein [Methylobacterium sp. Leaf117]KQP95984.1 hypothetical protein ASF57_19820 [Methylobacterium sp. Leaf117]